MKTISGDVWGKLYYMERDMNCAKLYIRHSNIAIDNMPEVYDGLWYETLISGGGGDNGIILQR